MNTCLSICGGPVYRAGGKDAAGYRVRWAVLVLLGTMAMAGKSFAHRQSPSPASAAEIAAVEKNDGPVSDVTEPSQSPAKQQKDDHTKPKKQKRGSLIIAPIPISSPAFGSGLLLITSYVFKFDEQDKTSPPSWIGMAGAFT